jgi:hypothetical protein
MCIISYVSLKSELVVSQENEENQDNNGILK